MSNSVVAAAAASRAKHLARSKKITKRPEDQVSARDERESADHDPKAAKVVQASEGHHHISGAENSMSGEFSFANALAGAASSNESLSFAQDSDGGSSDNGSGGGGTLLAIGAVGLVGAGVAVLASGGSNKSDGPVTPPANRAPTVSAATQAVTTDEDVVKTGTVTATDADGDTLAYSVTTQGGKGVAAINSATGAFTYTPNADVNGSDSFVVTVADGKGGTVTQTVNVTITPVNDDPFPLADNSSAITTAAGTAVEFIISFDDIDSDELTVAISQGPAHGTISEDGTTYTPTAGFSGQDSFTYVVSDGDGGEYTHTVTVTVGAGNPGEFDGELNLDGRGSQQVTVTLGDGGEPAGDVDLASGAFTLLTDIDVTTNVVIKNFGSNDLILVSGTDDLDQYSFTTGVGSAGADDLVIEFSNPAAGTVDFITLEDVITSATPIYSYDSAVAALGFDFMRIA